MHTGQEFLEEGLKFKERRFVLPPLCRVKVPDHEDLIMFCNYVFPPVSPDEETSS